METNDPKPKDNKTFWMASHCGPGTIDENETCGYCGETMGDCARTNTKAMKDTGDQQCGGSGFWCSHCGRFWAEDSCGERHDEPAASDDAECKDIDNVLHCCCGGKLYNIPQPISNIERREKMKRKLTIAKAIKNIADALEESGEEFIAEIYEQATGVKAAFEREPSFITVLGLTDQEIQEVGEKHKLEDCAWLGQPEDKSETSEQLANERYWRKKVMHPIFEIEDAEARISCLSVIFGLVGRFLDEDEVNEIDKRVLIFKSKTNI